MSSGDGPKILVVSPGSTSTRVALFMGEAGQGDASLPAPRFESRTDLWGEFPARLKAIREWLAKEGVEVAELSAVVGRGGLFRPVEGGTYLVTEAMLADAKGNLQGVHASNLGCALARAMADEATRERARTTPSGSAEGQFSGGPVPALVVDPVSTDEFEELARYSGLREIPRRSLGHALNIHALVQEVCKREGRNVKGSRFVVAHLGGGISVCPVADGRIQDANDANSGGPFSPTRAGGLPIQEVIALSFSGKHTVHELEEMTVKRGGLMSYLGTDDAREVEKMIDRGDEEARTVYEAMAYQVAKEIGAMATVLNGRVERILLTGGLAASDRFTAWIRERVGFLAPVEVWPEVEEMKALARGALGVLKGEIQPKEY